MVWLLPAAEGSITLDGADITRSSIRERSDLGISAYPKPPDDLEQEVYLLGGEDGGRLVKDKDLSLPVEHFQDLHLEKSPAHFGPEVLKVEHLTVKNSDGFPVVKDISFSIRAGEIFAIAGVSGNGQTEIAWLRHPAHQ